MCYRVDRMLDVEATEEPVPRNQQYEYLDPTERQPWLFGVFNDTPAKVTLAVELDAMSLVIDKLGTDVDTVVSRDGKVRVYARVVPSHDFYGWLFQVSDVVELEAPKRVVREYRERLERAVGRFS